MQQRCPAECRHVFDPPKGFLCEAEDSMHEQSVGVRARNHIIKYHRIYDFRLETLKRIAERMLLPSMCRAMLPPYVQPLIYGEAPPMRGMSAQRSLPPCG
jgi:hypothetical protein